MPRVAAVAIAFPASRYPIYAAVRAKKRKDRSPFHITQPTRERARHGRVERLVHPIADDTGAVGRPYRAIDILAAMERRGSITPEMRGAGEQFRERFLIAHLDPLHAASFERVPKSSSTEVPGFRMQAARDSIWRAVCAVGGLASPAGSVLWHVIGFEKTVKEWALMQGWSGRLVSQEAASGILIAALGVLEAHYAIGPRR